jgi:hypothetical protein
MPIKVGSGIPGPGSIKRLEGEANIEFPIEQVTVNHRFEASKVDKISPWHQGKLWSKSIGKGLLQQEESLDYRTLST